MTGRILIADKVPTNRIILKVKLSAAYYEVTQAANGADLLTKARDTRPNLIILDQALGDMTGFDACRALKADPVTAHIPVAIITPRADTQAKIAALKAGADEFLTKPLDELTLTARVRALMRASATADELRRRMETAKALGFAEAPATFETRGTVTLVGSTVEEAQVWRAGLRSLTDDAVTIKRADTLLETVLRGDTTDLYVISAGCERTDGLRLLADLRASAETRHAGIVVVHGDQDRREALMALDLGANDIITRSADPEEMALRLRTLMRRKKDADRLRATLDEGLKLATTDPLTGLYNRRYALPHLDKIARESATTGNHFALLLLDIDRFKAINDTYGHGIGDEVLVEVAARMRANLRGMDMIARFGGEEFLIGLPLISLVGARDTAERLRAAICALPLAYTADGAPVTASVSIGLAMGGANTGEVPPPIETLINIADRALFAAKAEGRNQVTLGSHAA